MSIDFEEWLQVRKDQLQVAVRILEPNYLREVLAKLDFIDEIFALFEIGAPNETEQTDLESDASNKIQDMGSDSEPSNSCYNPPHDISDFVPLKRVSQEPSGDN